MGSNYRIIYRLLLPSASSQPSLLKPMPSPRLRLMPTTVIITATAWPTMDTDTPTMDTTATPMLTTATTTARGLLTLSPRLMPTTVPMDTVWPITDTGTVWPTMDTTAPMLTPMLTATTTARDLLTPSPRLMLSTATTTDTLPTDTPTVDTTATT